MEVTLFLPLSHFATLGLLNNILLKYCLSPSVTHCYSFKYIQSLQLYKLHPWEKKKICIFVRNSKATRPLNSYFQSPHSLLSLTYRTMYFMCWSDLSVFQHSLGFSATQGGLIILESADPLGFWCTAIFILQRMSHNSWKQLLSKWEHLAGCGGLRRLEWLNQADRKVAWTLNSSYVTAIEGRVRDEEQHLEIGNMSILGLWLQEDEAVNGTGSKYLCWTYEPK